MRIHGSGNKTPYADIDLTLKADHLPESDSSEEEDPDTNNEFMTLDDIQKLDKPSVWKVFNKHCTYFDFENITLFIQNLMGFPWKFYI